MAGSDFPRVEPLGDMAAMVRLGDRIDRRTFQQVRALAERLGRERFPGFVEYVPAFASVAVYYDPRLALFSEVCAWINSILPTLAETTANPPRQIEIPACYGGEFGPDLEFVAEHARLRAEEVVQIHAGTEYLVYMIGFAPGFPYLGGMSPRLAAPRRSSPRLKIPAGSVGIAGTQTGVYPLETPGGWQLIGRTPLALFRPSDDPPTLLRAGDMVRFRAIDEDEYHALRERPR